MAEAQNQCGGRKLCMITCSLITLDKLLLERADLTTHFPASIIALEESFSVDQLREEDRNEDASESDVQAVANTTSTC